MYTRCPHCLTYFKISAEQLKKAGGKVRCGQCTKVFNSLGNLLEDLPVALSDRNKVSPQAPAAPRAPNIPSKPTAATPSAPAAKPATPKPATPKPAAPKSPAPKPAAPVAPPRPASKPTPAAVPPPSKMTAAPLVGDDALVFHMDEKPKPPAVKNDERETLNLTTEDKIEHVPGSFSAVRDLVLYPGPRPATAAMSFGNTFWNVGVAVLLTLFIIQYSYSMRDDLARYPELRPLVQKMCEMAKCEMPMQQDVDLIKLTHRDITVHPRVKGALFINAVFVNNATFIQPFPLMQITLSDITGRVIAKRRFQPTEYLDADINIRRGMTPNNPVQIVLEIADPGKDAVNFEFNFFYQAL